MGKTRVTCEYCNKSYENSHEARQRHNRGRNHKTNVKLWYDSYADQERHAAAATHGESRQTVRPTSQNSASWISFSPSSSQLNRETLATQNLPPSMHPAPPSAYFYCWSDWG